MALLGRKKQTVGLDIGSGLVKVAVVDHSKREPELVRVTVTPLLADDKGYRFTVLPEEKVLDRPAIGIQVSQADHRDVALYFDRVTGLLVKKVLRPHAGGADSLQEEIFSDFKDVEGLKRPTRVRILINGVPHVEADIRVTEFRERIDDKEFTKP